MNRYETNVLNTAAQASTFVDERSGSPTSRYTSTSSYHANIEEESLRRAVLTCGDRLGYVHVGESHRGALGTGTVDFVQLFWGLAEIGYEGPITFELPRVASPDLSNTLCVWRDLWDDGETLARDARAYVLERMRAPRW